MKMTKKEMREMLEACRVELGFKPDDTCVDVPAHIKLIKECRESMRERLKDRDQALIRIARWSERLHVRLLQELRGYP